MISLLNIFPFLDTKEFKNKFNIDTLSIMVNLLPIIAPEDIKKDTIDKDINKFIIFIEKAIKRKVTYEENIDFIHACLDYAMSNPATEERVKSIEYLFKLEFLKN